MGIEPRPGIVRHAGRLLPLMPTSVDFGVNLTEASGAGCSMCQGTSQDTTSLAGATTKPTALATVLQWCVGQVVNKL